MRLAVDSANRSQLVSLLAICVSCFVLGGCNRGPVKTVLVTGRITYGGGNWPAVALVAFAPIEAAEGYSRRAGHAILQPDGSFEAGTFDTNDGLIPGTYAVSFRCVEATSSDAANGIDHVPKKYQRGESSGFEVLVPADDSTPVVVEFDVPST